MEPLSRSSIPVSVNVDLLLTNKQPGQMEPSPKSQTSVAVNMEPLLVTNGQPAQMEALPNIQTAMPFSMEVLQLSTNPSSGQAGASPKFQTSMSASGSRQLSLKNTQSIQMEQSPKAHGSFSSRLVLQQPLSINVQSMQKEPPSKVQIPNKGSKQVPSTSKLAKMEPLTKVQSATSPTLGTPQLSSRNKRKSQAEKLSKVQSINVGTQVASSTNRKTAYSEPSPKVQTESFESVRSKLRESLAAALALVSDEQRNSQATGKNSSSGVTNTQGGLAAGSEQGEISSVAGSGSSCMVAETPSESLYSKADEHDIPQKPDESHCPSSYTFTNQSAADYTQIWKCDMQDFELKHTSIEGDMSFSNNLVFKDELLQENGLCWASEPDVESSELKGGDPKRPKLTLQETSSGTKEPADKAQHLSTKIEAELFRLFGGVNKKYKEKGRSLLFNLKDPNNPELLERVLSEEISPKRLCSMTAEELASKQLSEWRIAKAEELAQMVVLPESDVDLRRLVKKTHKGEFQVEVEQDDTVQVEVALGANALPQAPTRTNETKNNSESVDNEAPNSTRHAETEVSENLVVTKKVDLGVLRPQDVQDFMVDDLKDAEFLPPIVSLDEFMEALDSEPPFENLGGDAEQDSPTDKKGSDSSDSRLNSTDGSSYMMNAVPEGLESKSELASHFLISKSDKASDSLVSKQDHLHAASADPPESAVDLPDNINSGNISTNHSYALASGAVSELDDSLQHITAMDENIWEGLVQLSISSLVSVSGFFKSGEKASTKEWPGFLEIKGRVRVDAFEKFLQELPSSRSRAIMVIHFQWKEGSPESGRTSLTETVDSYVADERVGFAEPAPGVELYFCPPHTRTIQMLEKHIPKEHLEALASTDNGLIGIVVWRRPHVTLTVSPRLSSNHKHSSSRKHSASRKQQSSNVDLTKKSSLPVPVNAPVLNAEPQPEEAVDDVPPGFGPRATGDEEDLPEFDFQGTRPRASNPHQVSGGGVSHHGRPLARPAAQMRELIHKYGQGETLSGIPPATHMQPHMQPWDDDEDDIPEWQPHRDTQPPLHGLHQQALQPHQTNTHLMPVVPPEPPILQAPPQLMPPLPLAMPMQPQMGVTQVAHGMQAAWHPGVWWPHGRVPADAGFAPHGGQQNGMGGYGNVQNATDWRSDVHRSRGV